MYILLGIILALVGVVMILSPRTFYMLTESWKNGSETEPSDAYILHTRIGGVVFLLIGIAGTVILTLL